MATETQNTEKKRPAMEVKKVFFSYGKNEILKGASLEIEKGKVTTIMGANGCDKSTLFPEKARFSLVEKISHTYG